MKGERLKLTPDEQKTLLELQVLIEDRTLPMGVRRIARTRYNNILKAVMRRSPTRFPLESGESGLLT